ncbi:MAG TPA: peptide deformylase [Bacteroidales bacterium]|nr:peptide deformylase [Bacteroidales bacterium]
MVLPVYVYGMSLLRKKAQEIDEDYEGLDELIDNMFETMYDSDGVGLAAPQIGLSIRLIVIDAARMEIEDEPELQDFKRIIINPIILEESGEKWPFSEGCLSIPNIREDVSRKSRVKIEYFDENWELIEEELNGVRARIVQHEYDHLEGVLFTDKINPLRKKLITPKLKAISKGRVDCDYKIIFPKK